MSAIFHPRSFANLDVANSQRNIDETRQEQIIDPPVISHKGRPRTARLTNARMGQQRGGGVARTTRATMRAGPDPASASASRVRRTYKFSLCRQEPEGHNRSNCPLQS
jgi:hypothetical protein